MITDEMVEAAVDALAEFDPLRGERTRSLREIARAALEAAEAVAWQPIETAPREHGRRLLLGYAGKSIGGKPYFRTKEITYHEVWEWGDRDNPPTHWREPLPAPPKEGA